MAGRPPARAHRTYFSVVVCALLACAASLVLAQPCDAERPLAAAAVKGEKFSLIAQQCNVLAEPARVHRAAQLDLYERAVTITLPPAESRGRAPAAAPAASTPAASTTPAARLDRNAARVLSLAPALTVAARAQDLDPLLLHAIAHIESRHNPRALSPAGARGVMQVMPATAQRFGVDAPERTLFDADTNLRASAALLRALQRRYAGDLRLMLAAYNAGEGAVAKHGGNVPPYPETQAYVRDVLAVYRRLNEAFAVSKSGALIARRVREVSL